jgi:uncharacterized protein
MSSGLIILLLVTGICIGTISGMVGIGGGVLVIPVLMIGLGFSQAKANGTSLAMLLPPIGIFAVLNYWKAGNVAIGHAIVLAIGFAIGAYLGAMLVTSGRINPTLLRILFATLLLYVAGRILFRPGGSARAALETSLLMIWFVGGYIVMRLMGRKLHKMPNWPQEFRDRRKIPFTHDYEI